MTDVDRLLQEFIAEHQAGGEADPLAFLARAPDRGSRLELEALIDGYLMHAPRVPVDMSAAAYEGSTAEKVVEALSPSITGVSGLWPTVLPDLRNRARIKRSVLVARLAESLGVGDRSEKVADYYNQMEQGRLSSAGVSGRVLEALGAILGQSAERLRAMGDALGPAAPPAAPGAVFARQAPPPVADMAVGTPAPSAPAGGAGDEAETGWDEVDELFRGGA